MLYKTVIQVDSVKELGPVAIHLQSGSVHVTWETLLPSDWHY